MLLACGALAAAAWAAYTYRKTKRGEAARWMVEMFRQFYRDDAICKARELIEYDFAEVAGPILERRVLDRQVPLDAEEREKLRDLDLVLNFLEQLLYLQDEGHLLERDREVFFKYWFDLLSEPDRAALRRYMRNCGYERCSAFLGLEHSELLFVYGSLMEGHGGDQEQRLRDQMKFLGPCRLAGKLYSRGSFPAMVEGEDEGEVEGELFLVPEKRTFRKLDELEHYDPFRPEQSRYRRRCVRALVPAVDVWTYVWNEPVDALEWIEGGSWRRSDETLRA